MVSSTILNLDALLQPINEEDPSGLDLRLEISPQSLYGQAKDARYAVRSMERQSIGSENNTSITDTWKTIHKITVQILTDQSKDLEVAAWLTESLIRIHGFQGLKEGFQLLLRLCEQFWDSLYPRPDEEGVLTTIAPLVGLNGEHSEGTLISPIAKVPITEGRTLGPFALWQYQIALEANRISDPKQRQKRFDTGIITLDDFNKAVLETNPGFFSQLLDDLQACIGYFNSLSDFLDENCGADSMPVSAINCALTDCVEIVKAIFSDVRPAIDTTSDAVVSDDEIKENIDADITTPTVSKGLEAYSSRDEAIQSMLKVAAYFRRTEPHSVIPYLIERTVRWARMPLPELMNELVTNQDTRKQLTNLTGLVLESEEE